MSELCKDLSINNLTIKSKLYQIPKNNKTLFLLLKMRDYKSRMQHTKNLSLYNMKLLKKKWEDFNKKYKEVFIYGIEFVSIGETIPRLFLYLKDRNIREDRSYHIVLPTFYEYYKKGIFNEKVFDIFGSHVHFINEKNYYFWLYVIILHHQAIKISNFDLYKFRDISNPFKIEIGQPLIPFSKQMEIYGKKKLSSMGVYKKFICIHARECATKKKNFSSTYTDTSILDTDINSFRKACGFIQDLGYQVVRIGKDESKNCKINGVIDYANNFYDEFMDFYLIANCSFLLGGMAGIVSITAFWGKPVLQTNAVSLCYHQESLPRTAYDLYIPKKFYSKRKKRFLNLYEMLDVSFKCNRDSKKFEQEQIILYDNSDEEIFHATKEMYQKLFHTWLYTEDEKKLIEKYWFIINVWRSKHKNTYTSRKSGGKGFEMLPCPICYSFLRKNEFLLDVEAFK